MALAPLSRAWAALAIAAGAAGCGGEGAGGPPSPGSALPAAAFSAAAAAAAPGTLAASVNGAAITVDAVAAHARATGLAPAAALDDLVAAELLAAEALKRGLAADPDVIAAGRRAMVRRYVDEQFAPAVAPSEIPDAALRAVYEANRHWMEHDRLVMTIHILAPVKKGAPPEASAAARAALEPLAAAARALPRYCHRPCLEDATCGERHLCVEAECAPDADAIDWCSGPEDCAAAADSDATWEGAVCAEASCHRPCATAADCGAGETCRATTNDFLSLATDPSLRPERITAWYPPDAPSIDPAYLAAAHALKTPGDVGGPVQSSFGWHLILLTAEQPPLHADFDEARALLLPRYLPAFQKERFGALMRSLAGEHAVFVDEAAVGTAFGAAPLAAP